MPFDPALPFEEVEDEFETLSIEPKIKPSVSGFDPTQPFEEVESPEEQGIIRQVADIPLGIARGGVTGIKMMTDILGADNPVSKSLSGVEGYMADLMSAQAKEDQQEISRIMKDAEDKGFGEQVKAGIKAFSIAPVDIMSQALGTMAPVIATGLAGSAAKLGALGMRAVQAGVGAGMGAGMIKGEIYNEVKNELVNSGIAEDAAEKAAVEAQSYGGKNLDQILLGAGLGAASTLGAEGIITRILTKQGTTPAAGVVSRVLKGGLTEAAPEAAQAAQEQLAKNVALQREGFDVDPSRGVVAAATMEAVAAAPLGGIAGAVERPAPIKTLAEENLEQTNEIARKVAENGAPLTASAIQDQAATNLRQDELAKQLEAQLEEELVAVKEPTAAAQKPMSKDEFKAIYSQVAPEELDAAEAGFTNTLATAATEEARANAQNALEAIKEVKATVTPPAPTITPAVTPAVPTAQPPITDATKEIIQPEGVRPELETGVEVPTPQAGVSRGVFDTTRGQEEGQVVPTTQPIISEIPPTSELVGAEPTQPTIREVPEISPIVGAEPAAIVEQESVAPAEPKGTRVAAAAYIAPDGTQYTGPSHLAAMEQAKNEGKITQTEIDAKQAPESRETPQFGYKTDADPFVTRDQAEGIARQSGQLLVEKPATGQLHSNEVALDEFPKEVAAVTPTPAPAHAITPAPAPTVTPAESAIDVARRTDFTTAATREEAGEIGRNIASQDPNLPPPPPPQFDVLQSISNSQSRKAYNPDVLTEEAINEARENGFITGKKVGKFRFTESGRNQLREWSDQARDRSLALDALRDEIGDIAVSQWDAANAPESAAAIAARTAPTPVTTPPVTEAVTPAPAVQEIISPAKSRKSLEGAAAPSISSLSDGEVVALAEIVSGKTKQDIFTKETRDAIKPFLNSISKEDAKFATSLPLKYIPNQVREIILAAQAEPVAEPAGISVGNRIKLGKSPQTYTIEEVIPQSATERELGEQYYSVKNERTGETQVVEAKDLRQVKGKGARKLFAGERAEIPQFMRDSLDSARAMAAAGKTTEEIRAVTGWFPGKYDGKMRWEIPDNKARFIEREFKTPAPKIIKGTFGKNFNFTQNDDGSYYAEINGKPHWATGAETREGAENLYYEFNPRKIKYGFGVSGKLFDVIDHGNLFKAYPSAREIAIQFELLPPEKLGAYVRGENKIVISSSLNKNEALSTILHEIQHWVQEQEGFVKGGSPDLFSDSSSYDDFYKNWQNIQDSLTDAYILRGYMDRLGISVADAKSEYRKEFEKEHHPEAGGLAKTLTKEQILEEVNQHGKRLDMARQAAKAGSSFEAYRKVAGEIEARDVQARLELTDEQRSATEPYSSENIALEDAIVIQESEGAASEVSPTPENILITPPDQQYTFNEVFDVAYDMFGGEIPEGFAIVNDSKDKDFEFKAAYIPESGEIIVNLAYLNKNDDIRDTITHELGHYIYGDPEFRAAFDQFIASLSPEARADLDAYVETAYNKETGEIRLEEKMVRAFVDQFINEENAPAWRSMLDAIKRFLNKLGFKFNISDRDAISVFTAALDRYKAGEAISREGGARKIIDDLTAMDAEYLAAVERGDMETAQRMVDEAAKKAGYTIAAGHATPFDFNVFDRAKISDDDPDTSIRGFFFSTQPSEFAAYVSGSAERGARGKTKIINAYLNLGKVIGRSEATRIIKQQLKNDPTYQEEGYSLDDSLYFPKNADTVEFVAGLKLTDEKKRQFEETGEIKEGGKVFVKGDPVTWTEPDGSITSIPAGVDYYTEADDYGPRQHIVTFSDLEEAYRMHGESIYIVRDSNQIKRADPVTYDDAGDVIPLSQRFRPTSPDIRRMAAEPRTEQFAGIKTRNIITTPVGITKKTTDVIRAKFFDSTSISPEKTAQAWSYISQFMDDTDNSNNYFAGYINDAVDDQLTVDEKKEIGTKMGAALFTVELTNYAGKLAAQGDTKMLAYMIRNGNKMPTALFEEGTSANARSLNAMKGRLNNNVSGLAAFETEMKSNVERLAAKLFGTNAPSAEQIKIAQDALTQSESAELDLATEVADEIKNIGDRTKTNLIDKIDGKIKTSANPKKEELLISFQNLNQDRKFAGIRVIYKPQKIDPAKNIQNLIVGNLADYRKTLVKQGADGLESTFWQTMSSKERKPGPLGELDQAQNNELAKIVQKTLTDLGLKGKPPNTKMTDIEKVAAILNEQRLGEEKKVAADKKIVEEIERRRSSELEVADDADAVNAKYDSILNAWNEAMSRQTNMPISDNMLQRLINAELKERGTSITELINTPYEDVVADKKKGIVDSIIRRVYGVSKEAETGVEISEDYDNLSSYLKQTLENMYKLQAEKRDAAVARTLQRGLGDLPPLPETQKNKVQTIVQQDLRQQPDMGRREPWKNMLVGKLTQAGVAPEQAENIANLVWRQHEINDANRKIKEMKTAAEKGSLAVIIDRIKNTSLERQQSPEWKQEVIKEYLRDAGLSSQAAETAAKLYDSVISERLAAAKQKAFEDTLAKAAPWKNYASRNGKLAKDALKKIKEAIRTGVLDPEKNTESIIAALSGWTGFTKEQYQRIVELDTILNDPNQDDITKREAMDALNKIITKAKMPVRFKDALGAYYIGNALMGIPTALVNIASPLGFSIRNLMVDIAKYAKENPAKIPVAFETFLDSMRSWYNQTAYAFKNQIYLNDVVEYLNGQNVLRETFDKGKKQWAEGKYAQGFANMAVGMTQITGRVLSALDQGAISMLENQNITRYAMSALENAKNKVPKNKVVEFANMTLDLKRRVMMESIAAGMDKDRAGVLADLAVKSELRAALSEYGADTQSVLDSAINDALQSVGRNKVITINGIKTQQQKLSDSGMLSYWPIKMLEKASEGVGSEGSGMQIFAKMVYGFALVPARTFHTAAWFSPYGFLRLAIDKYKKNKGYESPYAMSVQTDAQFRQRLTESIAGSIAMLGLFALRSGSSDEDEDKKFKIVITGNGPNATTDKQYYDSWIKKYKPYSIHIVVGDTVIPINIGRGGEALFFPIMLAGALDDYEIKKKQNLTKKEPSDLNVATEMLGSAFFALAQRGPYAAFTEPLFDASKQGRVTENLVSQLGYFGKTFVPVLGASITRNISDFINDPVDRSSIEGALYANTPIVGPWIGTKALNALGQPIRADDWGDKLYKLGVPVVFSFPKNTPENALNELILKQGSGPTLPTRANAQKRFGDVLTDKEFETYVREYGRVMSDKMFKNRTRLANMKAVDYDDELEKYARGYSIDGIKIKGASDSAVLAVKRMRQ